MGNKKNKNHDTIKLFKSRSKKYEHLENYKRMEVHTITYIMLGIAAVIGFGIIIFV